MATLRSGFAGAMTAFARLDGEFLDAVLAAADVAGQAGRPALVVGPLRNAAELEPLNELVQASLVTTLAAAGHRAEALAAYRSVRVRLADELGIAPGPDLQEAYRRTMTPSVPAPGDPVQPLPGGSLVIVLPGLLPEDLIELCAFLSNRRGWLRRSC